MRSSHALKAVLSSPSFLNHKTFLPPHSASHALKHSNISFSESPWEEARSSYWAWNQSSWKVLEAKVFHCHLITPRPCQSGLTHQGFLHLTKSIYFSSIKGDISRGSLSDIHSFWIEKIAMSVDHGSNKTQENEASGNKRSWLLKII